MVKAAEKIIYIQDFDGGRVRFEPVELQTRLINCFLTAGLRDASYMAEDIALAVEFTLLNSKRPELIFGRGELTAAVVRMLEETGFPEVAALYRQNGGERMVTITSDPAAIADFLHKFLACSDERFDRVVLQVARAVELLEITEAGPHLLLELARHYERQNTDPALGGHVAVLKSKATVTQAELIQVLPRETRELVESRLIRINGMSKLFPCIRIFFMMNGFAEKFHLSPPVTEMEVEPLLYRMSRALESGRVAIEEALQPPEALPLYLTIPDMSEFITVFFGAEWSKSEKIGQELARVLGSELKGGVYKLTLN